MPAQTKIKVRRGNTAAWSAAEGDGRKLDGGELGFDTDTGKLKVGNGTTAFASLTAKADLADRSTNIVGGLAGSLPYQTAANTTALLGVGTSSYILTSSGTAPQWTAPSSFTAGTATNIAGGAAGSLPYQTASGTTGMLAVGTSSYILTSNGTGPQWSDPATVAYGTATNASYVATTNDTSATTGYITWVGASSGNNPVKVTSTKLTFNASTGVLTSTGFAGPLTGNASTATVLATSRTINGVSFNGSANITVTATATNALTIGTGLTGTSYTGASAVTITAKLTDSVSITDSTTAASATAVHAANDLAAAALPKTGGTMSGAIAMGTSKITGLGTPTADSDATTKSYVDTTVASIDWKKSVHAATVIPGTLSTAFAAGQIIDGVTLALNDRILIKNQSTASDNGIYTVNASGAPTRATDADVSSKVTAGMAMFVEEGDSNGDTGWVLQTNDTVTLGSTDLTFGQFTGAGSFTAGTGLSRTGNTLNVSTIPVANGGTGETSYTNGQILVGNSTGNTLTKTTLSAGSNISVTNGTGSISVAVTGIGSTIQAYDADLTSIAALATGTGVLKSTSGTWSLDNSYTTSASTFYLGTTSMTLGRASASQALTGISSLNGITVSGTSGSFLTTASTTATALTTVAGGAFKSGAFTKIDAGYSTITTSTTGGSTYVAFNMQFIGAPSITVTYRDATAYYYQLGVLDVDSSDGIGFVVKAQKTAGASQTVGFNWIAVGV